MGAPSCAGPDVPHHFFTTLELLNTGALSKSTTLEFGLERQAVPGRTGSHTLELLFLLVGPGPPLHSAPKTPGPGMDSLWTTKEGAASSLAPSVPLLAGLFHHTQVWLDEPH